jgi:hypothetical protein
MPGEAKSIAMIQAADMPSKWPCKLRRHRSRADADATLQQTQAAATVFAA